MVSTKPCRIQDWENMITFTVNANMDNESRLSAMAENENKHMIILLFFL